MATKRVDPVDDRERRVARKHLVTHSPVSGPQIIAYSRRVARGRREFTIVVRDGQTLDILRTGIFTAAEGYGVRRKM